MTDKTKPDVTGADQDPAAPISDAERDARAMKVVDRFSIYGGAGGLVPFPVADVATVAGVQFQMLRRLAQIYGVPFSRDKAKTVIASAAGSIVPVVAASGVASALKTLPFVGTTLGVITAPACTAGATYLLGKVFIRHFASGGTLLDFDPAKYREFAKAQQAKPDTASRPTASP
jgi:uncharacterized protein (DUF697 family)